MSRLDDELSRAVEESEASEADAPAAAADVKPAAPEPKKSNRRLKNVGFLAALLAMAAAILGLVLTTAPDAAVYSKGVDELLAEKERLAGRNVRVTGMLVKGSLKRRDEPCEYRFKMMKNSASVDVRFAECIVPDTFRDVPGMDVEVTAEGKLAGDESFEATHIMAKCPSKYEMKQRAAGGEQAPHEMTPASAPRTY
jgi:cytochrome c-type biogenesis protein CcmE